MRWTLADRGGEVFIVSGLRFGDMCLPMREIVSTEGFTFNAGVA